MFRLVISAEHLLLGSRPCCDAGPVQLPEGARIEARDSGAFKDVGMDATEKQNQPIARFGL
jgi:hypothetical protein